MTGLEALKRLLDADDIHYSVEPSEGDRRRDQLVLVLGSEHRGGEYSSSAGRQLRLEVLADGAVSGQAGAITIVQHTVMLPFVVRREHIGAFVRMLLLTNSMAELPGFGFEEATRSAYYRHVLVATTPIDPGLIRHTLSMVALTVHMFSPHLERVAHGERSVEDILRATLGLS